MIAGAVTGGRHRANGTDVALTIDERTDNGWLVITVGGDLDLYTVQALRSRLSDALVTAEASARHSSGGAALQGVVVDLAGVTFMDSAGLGVLVGAYKRAQADGLRLQLAGPSPTVTKLFQITGLSRVFIVQPSVADAVHAHS